MAGKKPFKKRPRLGRAPDPGDWNRDEKSPTEAIAQADRIIQKLKDAPGSAWDKAFRFFSDVDKKVIDMKASIQAKQTVSEGQERTLTNWEAAVDKVIAQEPAAPTPEGL